MGAGMTFVIIGGNFDLSVGSLLSLCSVICIDLHDKIGPIPAILVTLVVGMASGVVTGYLCGYLRLNSMIVTLGMMNVLQALAMMYTNGQFVQMADSNAWFTKIGKGKHRSGSDFHHHHGAVYHHHGYRADKDRIRPSCDVSRGNDEACRYSGINDKLVILKSFVLSGLATAVGAIMLCSRGAAAQATIGETYEFDVISGVILEVHP